MGAVRAPVGKLLPASKQASVRYIIVFVRIELAETNLQGIADSRMMLIASLQTFYSKIAVSAANPRVRQLGTFVHMIRFVQSMQGGLHAHWRQSCVSDCVRISPVPR